jgi:hypothetical protein
VVCQQKILRTHALEEIGKHTLNEHAQIGFKEAENINLHKKRQENFWKVKFCFAM